MTSAACSAWHADEADAAAGAGDLPEVIRSATEGPASLYRKGREDGIYRRVKCCEAVYGQQPKRRVLPALPSKPVMAPMLTVVNDSSRRDVAVQ